MSSAKTLSNSLPADPLMLRAIRNESVERPPIWIMRQAGRYLSEYRELKEKHGFLGLCSSPELAVEVSMQPVRYLDVDAAIIFSDILIPMSCLGIEVAFDPGPKIANPLRSTADINQLRQTAPLSRVSYVFDAIKLLKTELDRYCEERETKAVIGFAGAPWTLACYILDQGPYKHFQYTQVLAQESRAAVLRLLDTISEIIAEYVLLQVQSGAQIIQLFDTWAGNLNREDFEIFALPYLQKLTRVIQDTHTPCIIYLNSSHHLLESLRQSGANCISIDWKTPLSEARARLGDNIVLQGNLDPTHLFREKHLIEEETSRMLGSTTPFQSYIANLGHGILVNTPRENALAFVNSVKSFGSSKI